ncbi:hypothetical protein [Methanobrevibacter sp. DSM 116169]|uniref:hypothetical protein n=1 Tax=Methanobrevibacter sp. DSM 116169 TaxID=3242727 RepID=UPI0038FCE962
MIQTKIYKGFKLTIPAELRKKLGIDEKEYVVNWEINKKGKLELDFEKKKKLIDFAGIISDDTLDSVEAKKKASRGEK